MSKDHIGYEALTEQALRSVVKAALKHVEKQGLIGAHHFYLTFKTRDPGVEIPEFLLERYPEEITIVLQNQYWGLKVGEDEFEVSLTFQKMPATLVVPFAALTAFVDPSVQFGLQFRNSSAAKKVPGAPEVAKPAALPTASEKTRIAPRQESAESKPPAESTSTSPQVVSIDKFRKK
jgi:uncharacterized protein